MATGDYVLRNIFASKHYFGVYLHAFRVNESNECFPTRVP